MSAVVMKKTSSMDFVPDVYSAKPNSWWRPFRRSSSGIPDSTSTPPNPSCGIGLPVTMIDKKIAGTIYAKINTQY